MANEENLGRGIEFIRSLFGADRLAFPRMPEDLAGRMRVRGKACFSSRTVSESPYHIAEYVREYAEGVDDYALLAHSGYGANSWALHYFLAWGRLGLFIQLPWGGAYSDAEGDRRRIKECFVLADRIVETARRVELPSAGVAVCASGFYGGGWWTLPLPGKWDRRGHGPMPPTRLDHRSPAEILTDAAVWMQRLPRTQQRD